MHQIRLTLPPPPVEPPPGAELVVVGGGLGLGAMLLQRRKVAGGVCRGDGAYLGELATAVEDDARELGADVSLQKPARPVLSCSRRAGAEGDARGEGEHTYMSSVFPFLC